MSYTLTNTGDLFLVYLDYPLMNISQIFGYEEDVTGDTGNLTREFRYTTDLLNWSDWILLSDLALQSIAISATQDFNIQFRYTKTDSVGTIDVCWIKLKAQSGSVEGTLEDTVFDVLDEDDFNSIKLWCENVLEKMYVPGIVPKYINRGSGTTDRDYVDFWRGVICMFSILTIYSRRFESLEKLDILKAILDSLGVYYNPNSSISDLQNLVYTSFIVFESRGVTYDEIESLYGRDETQCGDIFIFSDSIPGTIGFWLDRNSLIERYIHNQIEVEVLSIRDTSVFVNCTLDTDLNTITVDATSYIETLNMKVNSSIDYELVFLVQGNGTLTSVIKAFDSSGVEVNLLYLDQAVYPNPPLDGVQFPDNGKDYLVRLIVYGSGSDTIAQPDILTGSNLQMSDNICSLQIRIDFTGNLVLKDFFFKIIHTDYSKSFLQSSQLVDSWFRDRSTHKDSLDLVHQYLLNYNKTVLVNDLRDGLVATETAACIVGTELPMIYIDGSRFLLHKNYNNTGNILMASTLETGDVLDGAIPGGHLLGTYLGGNTADFTNPLVWNNWGGMLE